MATPRDIRRLAFQALYQLDARGDVDAEAVRAEIAQEEERLFSEKDRNGAFELALAAYNARSEADDAMGVLAPGWPAYRQPAVDRAILRLAHYEMVSGVTPPKIAVNEAIELAKKYSTERSPAFVNGVLDKILKQLLRSADENASVSATDSETARNEEGQEYEGHHGVVSKRTFEGHQGAGAHA